MVELVDIEAIKSQEVLMKDSVSPINSKELFGVNNMIFIQHQGCIYCLRRTRNGKLILNK